MKRLRDTNSEGNFLDDVKKEEESYGSKDIDDCGLPVADELYLRKKGEREEEKFYDYRKKKKKKELGSSLYHHFICS